MLLPEFIVQPVAWSVVILIIASLLVGEQSAKKNKIFWLLTGLGISYLASTAVPWQYWLVNQIALYVGLLINGLIILLGIYLLFDFFQNRGVKFSDKITKDFKKLKSALKQPRPLWVYGLIGLVVGGIEPIRLQSTQQNELFLLFAQPSLEVIISLIGYLMLVLLPLVLSLFFALLIARNKKDEQFTLLWGSGALIVIGWLLSAIVTGLI